MTSVKIQLVAAAKGAVAELGMPNGWTWYSRVYPDYERAGLEANRLCDDQGWTITEMTKDTDDDG